ncbi:type II 3-dehydroquinate dehydratase [Mesorhizobium sp. A556]
MTARKNVFFLNGPNANLYGLDTSGQYGGESFPAIQARCEQHAIAASIDLEFRQTNHEGVLVDWIQEARQKANALIINAAGLTYTSISVLDALLALQKPIVEVHMSNIWKREPFRHHSYVSRAASAVIAGLGPTGYLMAIDAASHLIREE